MPEKISNVSHFVSGLTAGVGVVFQEYGMLIIAAIGTFGTLAVTWYYKHEELKIKKKALENEKTSN